METTGTIIPLALVRPGSSVRIEKIEAGRSLNQRLAEMGLVSGVIIKVLDGRAFGPLVVRVGESRLVLGQGMSMKIKVIPVDEGNQA